MKICPRCQRTYSDDNLNFCLDDGVVLQQAGASSPPPETVLMNQPRVTDVRAGTSPQPAWNVSPQQYAAQQKRSSKTWIWVVLVLGLVVLLCGGGLIGFFAYIASTVDSNTAVSSNTTSNSRTASPTRTPRPGTSPTPASTTDPVVGETQSIDMSDWAEDAQEGSIQEYVNGEYILGSTQKRYYYVVVAGNYPTKQATTRLTVRNIDNADTSLGYGIVFHSLSQPLIKDLAFLIDAKKSRYRVVKHSPGMETAIVAWTNSPAIKSGSEENVLEVRDSANNADLYINGRLVKSISTADAFADGVAGVYCGDGIRAAFKNFEIIK